MPEEGPESTRWEGNELEAGIPEAVGEPAQSLLGSGPTELVFRDEESPNRLPEVGALTLIPNGC